MEYEDYVEGPDRLYVNAEQFNDVRKFIKNENAKQFRYFMLALAEKRKIDAIRSLRTIADLSLKEAKDLVESLMDKEPQTLGGMLKEAVKSAKEPKYCVVKGFTDITGFGRSLNECREDAEYTLKNYPSQPVFICQIISESEEVTTYKMVDL